MGRHQGLDQRGVRATHLEGRTQQGRQGRSRHGDRIRTARGALTHPRDRGRHAHRDGRGLSDPGERREALRVLRRVEGGRFRRCGLPAQAGVQAGGGAGDRSPRDRDAAGRRFGRNRHRGRARSVAGGRQDGNHPGLHECLVRRIHAAGLHGRVGRVPGYAGPALPVLRRIGVRRHARRADLARLHVAGHGGHAGGELPGATASRARNGARRARAQVRARTEPARRCELHTPRRGRRLRAAQGRRSWRRPPPAARRPNWAPWSPSRSAAGCRPR